MAIATSRLGYPRWVQLGLWGISTRRTAWMYVIGSLTAAVLLFAFIFPDSPRRYIGLLGLVAALWYWLSIRWIDKNGSWNS